MRKPSGFDISVVCVVAVFVAIALWVPWSDHKKQLALEQNFERMEFGHAYPANAEARLVLRPVVIKKLVERRTTLEVSEAKLEEAEGQLRSLRGATNEVVLIASYLGEVERLRGEIVALDDQFYATCATAKQSSFDTEAKVSGCRKRSASGVVLSRSSH